LDALSRQKPDQNGGARPVSLPEPTPTVTAMSSIYDLQMESITGEQVDFDQFRDQMLLIVNVASN